MIWLSRLDFPGFQSTLPHGERRIAHYLASGLLSISIHAPARGATLYIDLVFGEEVISIHAPARGATRQTRPRPVRPAGFQSTLPHGERRQKFHIFLDYGILFIQYIQIKAFFISFKPFFHPISYILSVRVPPAFHVSLWFAPAKSSMSLPPRKKTWHQNALPWSGSCFPNDKIAGYLRFH